MEEWWSEKDDENGHAWGFRRLAAHNRWQRTLAAKKAAEEAAATAQEMPIVEDNTEKR